jgi:hypothetical protein
MLGGYACILVTNIWSRGVQYNKKTAYRGMTAPRHYIKKKSSHAGRENSTNPTSTHTQGPVTGENDP